MKNDGLKITTHKSRLTIAVVLLVGILCCSLMIYMLFHSGKQAKAYLAGYDDSNIMTDFVMSNTTTMSERNIWDFLHSKNPCNDRNLAKAVKGYHYNIRDGHFVCMADEMFSGQTTSHIIWQAAQDYHINPQVLLVVLEKEQRLISDTFPSNLEYNHATGFNCPDDGKGCRPEHAGFINQVRSAAAFFREVLDGGWSNYPAYETSNILYHPNRSCGSKRVYVANRATSALYRYTPYVPNQAALRANWGYGDACSAYGNRNFYNMFTNWFGSTRGYEVHGGILDGYNSAGGARVLGNPTMNESCGLKDQGCYQVFDRGVVYWTKALGGHAVRKGKIHQRWLELGLEYSVLGYPVGNQVDGIKGGGSYQNFEGGAILYHPQTGAHENYGGIRETYRQMKFENGMLGYPVSKEGCGLVGQGCYQHYQGGSIYWTPKYNGMVIYGAIRDKWFRLGFENSPLGYPTGGEHCYDGLNCYRDFERGSIYWYNGYFTYANYGQIAQKYREIGRSKTILGYPIMDQVCGLVRGGCYQAMQGANGSIYYSPKAGVHILFGGIKAKWMQLGYEWGRLGYPTSDEYIVGGGVRQDFEGGSITWKNGQAYESYR